MSTVKHKLLIVAAAALLSIGSPSSRADAQGATIPDTPTGAVVKAYFAAVKSGAEGDIAAFVKLAAEDPADEAERKMRSQRVKGIATESGGLTLVSVEQSSATSFTGRVKSAKGEAYRLTIEFGKRQNGTPFVDGVALEPVK